MSGYSSTPLLHFWRFLPKKAARAGAAVQSSKRFWRFFVRVTHSWSPRIDRLGRSVKDLQDIVHGLKAKGVTLKATEQPIDTGSAAGKCFLDMLSVFAEFETNLRRERQLEGIAKAKAAGVYAGKGRKPSVDRSEVARLRAEGLGLNEIAEKLGINRVTVYRLAKEAAARP
jgi:DNA invertase Pin-like site-specific DNA recombinase